MEACETCKFSRAYPEPGPEVQKPKTSFWNAMPPPGWWEWKAWRERKDRHENKIRCCVDPDEREKAKDSFCSRYQQAV